MSAPIVRIGDLEINQDLAVQARMWKIQRVGWAVIGVIVLSGLSGLFAHGPLSYTTGGDRHGALWVEYERFGRNQASSELRIHVRPASDPVRIWIGPDYTAKVDILRIVPEPAISRVDGAGFTFEVAAMGKDEPGTITVNLQFHAVGRMAVEVRSPGSPAIPIRQFIYP